MRLLDILSIISMLVLVGCSKEDKCPLDYPKRMCTSTTINLLTEVETHHYWECCAGPTIKERHLE